MRHAHKIGAVFYVLWGVLHMVGGVALLGELRSGGIAAELAAIADASPADHFAGLPPTGAIAGILGYYAWLIITIGLVAILIAVFLNWKHDRFGYWLSLALMLPVEIGIYAFLLKPGYMLWSAGGIGMSLFVLGAIFSTIGSTRGAPQAT